MTTIEHIRLSKLRNEELFGLLKRILNLGETLLTQENDIGVLTAYKQAVDEYDDALNQDITLKDTKNVKRADKRVLEYYRGIRRYLLAMLMYPDTEVRRAAKTAISITDKYRKLDKLPYNQRYGAIHLCMEELMELPEETITHLSLTPWLNAMTKSIKEFHVAREAQTAEKAAYQTGLVKETRRKAESAHQRLVRYINAIASIYGDEYYSSFINQTNAIITDAKAQLKARTTRAENDRKEEQTDNIPNLLISTDNRGDESNT